MTIERPQQSEIMPKAEAAKRTGLTVRRLNRAAKNGEIPSIVIDGEVLILRAPLEAMLEGRGCPAVRSGSRSSKNG
jgi:hypothetical protein